MSRFYTDDGEGGFLPVGVELVGGPFDGAEIDDPETPTVLCRLGSHVARYDEVPGRGIYVLSQSALVRAQR